MRAAVGLLFVFACVRTDTVACDDGTVCAAGTHCVRLTNYGDQIRCSTDDEIAGCEGKAQLEGCEGPDEAPTKRCYDGVCIETGCGNAILDPGESCDDGNQVDEPVGTPDACASDCSSRLTCGDGIVDLEIGETCDDATGIGGFGPTVARDGCTACVLDELEWVVEPHEPGPIDTIGMMAYDADRDRTVMLAQTQQEVRGGLNVLVWGTWEWDGVRWTRETPRVQPLPAEWMGMTYDHARRRIVVFGGYLRNVDRDTNAEWEWDGAQWTELTAGTRPSPRRGASLVYDARRERVILIGGYDDDQGDALDDIWARDKMGVWTQLETPPGFMARFTAAVAYDPVRDVIVVFGGESFGGQSLSDTWEMSSTGWTKLAPATSPSSRTRSSMAFDPVAQEMVLHGGLIDPSTTQTPETWHWNGTRWMQIGSTPSASSIEVIAAATSRAGLIAVRGTATELLPNGATTWSRVRAGTTRPDATSRDWAGAVDMGGGRIMLVGDRSPDDDVWLWSGADWTRLAGPMGSLPSQRAGASLTFDPVHQQFVLFGGRYVLGGPPDLYRNDTWVYDSTSTWKVLTTPSAPSGRQFASMQYDAGENAIILTGGMPMVNDTWSFDGQWHQLAPATSPPPTYGASSCALAAGEGTLLFGGSSLDTRVWRWRGGTWTAEPGVGSTRIHAASAYDAGRGQFVVEGGLASTSLTLDQTDQWRDGAWSVAPSGDRMAQHLAVSALDGHGVIEMMGTGRQFAMRQLRTRVSAVPESCGPNDDDGDGLARCDDPDCWQICTPYCPPGSDHTAPACAIGCGDGTCNAARENCRTCPGDCGVCAARCGDFACDAGETATTCPGDCP